MKKEGMAVRSLYACIADSLVDGELPRGFSLPEPAESDAELRWTDGALDGVTVYHMGPSEVSQKNLQLMTDAIRAAAEGDQGLADQLFETLAGQVRAIAIIDALQSCIFENRQKLDNRNLYAYALHLLLETQNRECLKFGLCILELYGTVSSDAYTKAIRTVGLSEEFALFAIFVMQHWKTGNDEIWELAKRLHGWGRIHAVDHLEPTTDEIRNWLLTEGVHNDVMPAYSALNCWQKSGAEAVLFGHPTLEQFAGIRDILDGLLDEGPVQGISAIENADAILGQFLKVAKGIPLTFEDCTVIHEIWAYSGDAADGACEMARICMDILQTPHCQSLILDAAKRGEGIEMAESVGIDCKPYILELLKTGFDEHSDLCRYVMSDDASRAETLEIFRQNLPLADMKTEPACTLGLGKEYAQQMAL